MTTWKWRGQPKTTTKTKKLPSQYQLKFYYEYDPETGIFSKNGKELSTKSNGYLVTKIDDTKYFIHRLVWVYMTGEEPDEIDHINRIKDDNRWENLRSVSTIIDSRNKSLQNSSSGVKGVRYVNETDRWRTDIFLAGKVYYIGTYLHPLDAIQARIEAEEIFWGKSHVHTNLK